ncbi:MAG: hypothetical protein ACLRR6_04865 [Oscillospiraceae bacterium]
MTMKNPRYWKLLAFTIAVIAIFSLLFGCTKQKLEPMTNIWISEYSTLNRVYNAEGEYLHTGAWKDNGRFHNGDTSRRHTGHMPLRQRWQSI